MPCVGGLIDRERRACVATSRALQFRSVLVVERRNVDPPIADRRVSAPFKDNRRVLRM